MRFWVTQNRVLVASGKGDSRNRSGFVVANRVMRVYVGELPREFVKSIFDLKLERFSDYATGGTFTQISPVSRWGRDLWHTTYNYHTFSYACMFVLEWMEN